MTKRATRSSPTAALLLLVTTVPASLAKGQNPEDLPVDVRVEGLFGDWLPADECTEVLVTLHNRSGRSFRGDLLVDARDWQYPNAVHRLEVDLPAAAERRFQVPLAIRGTDVRARYQAEHLLGRDHLPLDYLGGRIPGVVVFSDPPRLRAALGDLSYPSDDPYGGVRMQPVPMGEVGFDPATGDPVAPTSAVGWGGVKLLVASAPAFERLTLPQQEALRDWVRVGGGVLVFPRTPEDLHGPLLRSFTGAVEWTEGFQFPDHELLVPPSAQGRGFVLPPGSSGRLEAFGASFPWGFGRIFLASYDGAERPLAETIETRRLVTSVLRSPRNDPLFRFGGGDDSLQWGGTGSFHELRKALDPNESFRPALLLVGLVLLVYVFVVGPLNFRYVAKKNRPLLALVTTPAAALGFFLLLLAVGYIGKGTSMRYRAVSLFELTEGDAEGPERRYLGLFLTRSATFDMPSARRGVTRLLEGGTHRLTVLHRGDETVLEGLQGTLWETLFVREETIASLGGGGIVFERRGRNLAAVRNDSSTPLEGAVVVDMQGGVYPVGDVPAGATVAIAGSPELTLPTHEHALLGPADPKLLALTETMGLPPGAVEGFYGLLVAAGSGLSSDVPVLWARLPVRGGEVAGRFALESELRLLRVVPRVESAAISVQWDEDAGGAK